MGKYSYLGYSDFGVEEMARQKVLKKLSVIPLVFLIFYEVSGVPFGAEDSVKAAGPLLALIGFLVFPFMWSLPEALITPLMGILFSASGVVSLSWLSFQEIVAVDNYLYCLGMILEYIAFIRLRIMRPTASRPYKVPLGTIGVVILCVPPTLLIFMVLAIASLKIMVISFVVVVIGLVMYPGLKCIEKKRWVRFSTSVTVGHDSTEPMVE